MFSDFFLLPSMSSEDADAAAGAAAARQNALACQVKFFFVRWIFFACQVNFYCWRRDFFCFPGEFFLVRWIFVVVCLHFFSLSLFSNQKSTNLTECFCLPCEIFFLFKCLILFLFFLFLHIFNSGIKEKAQALHPCLEHCQTVAKRLASWLCSWSTTG